MSDMTFYGIKQKILTIDYHHLAFILLKCDWIDNRNGIKVEFATVDLKHIGHK